MLHLKVGIFIINQYLNIFNSYINNNGMIPFGSGGGIQALAANSNRNSIIENNHSRFGGGPYIEAVIHIFIKLLYLIIYQIHMVEEFWLVADLNQNL